MWYFCFDNRFRARVDEPSEYALACRVVTASAVFLLPLFDLGGSVVDEKAERDPLRDARSHCAVRRPFAERRRVSSAGAFGV
jgi:hypothetical protein